MTTSRLPFKIEAQTVGVQHAYARFVKQYGRAEGTRIFLAKADEKGVGKTLREKCNSIYKRGATVG
jgi:hypothetical protein